MSTSHSIPHYPVAIVGGGQAGLSLSYYLKQRSIDHAVFEKHKAMHNWETRRWDNFSLVTPNWQCKLPGHEYRGNDPHGFMRKPEILEYLKAFRSHVDAPLREGVAVRRAVPRPQGGFELHTSEGLCTADQVVAASGGYHTPIIPRLAERLPAGVVQMHSEQYRNAAALPEGAVLVVGSGQSGTQIAEDLHLAGRKVWLAVGDAPRCARFYRGKDVVDWLADMRYYDIGVHEHPLREGVRDNTNHYVTGRDGGRDIDLRKFANEGMELVGLLHGLQGDTLQFAPDLTANLDAADAVYNRINASIDAHIARNGIATDEGPSVYTPVWKPAPSARRSACRSMASPPSSGASASRPIFPGSRRRCSTAAATPAMYAVSPPTPACTFWACPGSTPGARAVSPAWRATRCSWQNASTRCTPARRR